MRRHSGLAKKMGEGRVLGKSWRDRSPVGFCLPQPDTRDRDQQQQRQPVDVPTGLAASVSSFSPSEAVPHWQQVQPQQVQQDSALAGEAASVVADAAVEVAVGAQQEQEGSQEQDGEQQQLQAGPQEQVGTQQQDMGNSKGRQGGE